LAGRKVKKNIEIKFDNENKLLTMMRKPEVQWILRSV
jgi:hypothetical protein